MPHQNGKPDIGEKFAERLLELVENQHSQLKELVRDSIKELENKDEKLSDRILSLEQQSPAKAGKNAMSGGVAGASIVALAEAFRQIFGGGL